MSGLTSAAQSCTPSATPVELCPEGYPCPTCGATRCSCHAPGTNVHPLACRPPHDTYPFCNVSLSVTDRVADLVARIPDEDKPNLLTARGRGGSGQHMQSIPSLGVPAYYWGTNCLHATGNGKCVVDSHNVSRCPTNFPSGPSFGATFDRELIHTMANVIGVELRAMFALGLGQPSLDCWGPVINLNRDPRWGRNGEGGLEDAYAMGELASAWTRGFQAPRPAKLPHRAPRSVSRGAARSVDGERQAEPTSGEHGARTLLQGVITLKHMAVNSLENTAPFNRHNFDANASYGVSPFVLADYYLVPFERAITEGDARGIMCSYNAVLGKPTCLSPLMRNARKAWGFRGYVTSDSDSVQNAWHDHHYPPNDHGHGATALALIDGQCDIDSGDTYNSNIPAALSAKTDHLTMSDVDRALSNSLRQRFDLGLFDPREAYEWPGKDDVGTDASSALSLNASKEALVLLRNDGGLLPLTRGTQRIAVVGPHAAAREVMTQPYPSTPYCPPDANDPHADPLGCIASPFKAIADLNGDATLTTTAPGCDLFDPNTTGFAHALALARAADVVVLGLGIETCGLHPAHNVNPKRPGRCYQELSTSGYVFPDQYLELEAHDRTTIDLPPVQHAFAKAVLALNKPTVLFLMHAGALALDAFHAGDGTRRSAPLAIIEAFYPGVRGGEALAQHLFGVANAWGRMPFTVYPLSFEAAAPMTMHDLRVPPGRTYRYFREPLYPFGAGTAPHGLHPRQRALARAGAITPSTRRRIPCDGSRALRSPLCTGLTLTNWSVDGTRPACLDSLPTTSGTTCRLRLAVTNTGARAGDAVVLAYFRSTRSDAEWHERRRASGAHATLPPGVSPATLLTPLRQLFEFARVKDVAPGETRHVDFAVRAQTLALVDEASGDRVASAGRFELMFDSGAGFLNGATGQAARAHGAMLSWSTLVTGSDVVVTPFPSQA